MEVRWDMGGTLVKFADVRLLVTQKKRTLNSLRSISPFYSIFHLFFSFNSLLFTYFFSRQSFIRLFHLLLPTIYINQVPKPLRKRPTHGRVPPESSIGGGSSQYYALYCRSMYYQQFLLLSAKEDHLVWRKISRFYVHIKKVNGLALY